jgi:hypothetical protein
MGFRKRKGDPKRTLKGTDYEEALGGFDNDRSAGVIGNGAGRGRS